MGPAAPATDCISVLLPASLAQSDAASLIRSPTYSEAAPGTSSLKSSVKDSRRRPLLDVAFWLLLARAAQRA
jgi:hypothetical protein